MNTIEFISFFDEFFTRLEFQLENGETLIYEKCQELRRLVQLNFETKVQSLKKSNRVDLDLEIDQIKNEFLKENFQNFLGFNQIHLQRIDNYEKEKLDNLKNLNKIKIGKKLKEFQMFYIFMTSKWSSESESNKRIVKQLKKFKSKLLKFEEYLKNLILNHEILYYDSLIDHLYFKQILYFDNFKKICFDKDCILIDYQLAFKSTDSKLQLLKYSKNSIVSRLILDCHKLKKIVTNDSFILVHFYFKNSNPNLALIDRNLRLIKEKTNLDHDELLGADSNYLYFKYADWPKELCLEIWDWNLEKQILDFSFQSENPFGPFFIPLEMKSIAFLNDFYIYSIKLNDASYSIFCVSLKMGLMNCLKNNATDFNLIPKSENISYVESSDETNKKNLIILDFKTNKPIKKIYLKEFKSFEHTTVHFFNENKQFYFKNNKFKNELLILYEDDINFLSTKP